jgi:hypothetical protein
MSLSQVKSLNSQGRLEIIDVVVDLKRELTRIKYQSLPRRARATRDPTAERETETEIQKRG